MARPMQKPPVTSQGAVPLLGTWGRELKEEAAVSVTRARWRGLKEGWQPANHRLPALLFQAVVTKCQQG